MKFKIAVIFLACISMLSADAKVTTKKDIYEVSKGIAYLLKQSSAGITTTKLKRYFLVKEVKKPSFFSSREPIYNLYLASFLQKGTPYWLKDNKFVLHTSSSQRYLKKLKKRYHNRYGIEVVLYKNPNYRQEEFNLTEIKTDKLIRYLKKQIPEISPKKKLKEEKVQEKEEEKKSIDMKEEVTKVLPVISALVSTKKEAKNALRGIDELKKQIEEKTQNIELKRYFLAKKIEKPSLFGSMNPIYNLYLTSYLNKGTPAWLEGNEFVFHTSSNSKYLKKIQKLYKKKYHLDLTLYKNPSYKKEALTLAKIDRTDVIDYMKSQIPEVFIKAIDEEKKSELFNKERRETLKHKRKIVHKKKLERERKEAQQQMSVKHKIHLEAKRKAILEKKARQNKRKKIELKQQREVEQERAKILEKVRLEKIETIKAQKQKEQRLQEDERMVEKEEARREVLAKEKTAANKKMQEEKRREALKQKALEAERVRVAEEKEKIEEKKKRQTAKKKNDDELTSDLDVMLKDTKDFKKKLERSESIKYY